MNQPPPSLRGTALRLLAQREHSATEMRRKLLRIARRQAAADAGDGSSHAGAAVGGHRDRDGSADGHEASEPGVEQVVDAVLDWLLANNHLSEARFAESRVHARAARHGNLRIRHELAQHGIALAPDAAAELAGSELQRATAVWLRKFGQAPADARERGRQARFLAGRGFAGDTIRAVFKGMGTVDPEADAVDG